MKDDGKTVDEQTERLGNGGFTVAAGPRVTTKAALSEWMGTGLK